MAINEKAKTLYTDRHTSYPKMLFELSGMRLERLTVFIIFMFEQENAI